MDDVYDISETAKTVRNLISHRDPYAIRNGTKAFPEEYIDKLLREGFKKTRKGYELDTNLMVQRSEGKVVKFGCLLMGFNVK